MPVCPRCSRDNPAGARFCLGCGAGIVTRCSNCDGALPEEALFCPACGSRAERLDAPAPPAPLETIKLVTILFADVVGSTAQAELLSPDEVRALMADFFEAMIEEIHAQGGTVERLIGDAIMVDFGVPITREDDPVRAVRAARRMLDRLQVFNQEHAEPLQIQLRIGINTGQVSTGGSLGERLMVMGDAVNVAARLEQNAEPGTIVIGERTARSVRHLFDLRELAPLAAKGKSEPLRAFVVGGEHEPVEDGHSALLVGRDSEFQRLTEVLQNVERDHKPQVVTVVGEPGAGKTRLVTEFVDRSGALALFGRCAPLEGGLTLWPFREILRDLGGLSSEDSPAAALDKLLSLSSSLPPDLVSDPRGTAAALGATIGLESAMETLADLDPREIQRAIFAAWAALFSGLARQRPLVVIVDDIHGADAATLEMLSYLAGTIHEQVLFLCPTRPEFAGTRSEWIATLRDLTAIHLRPLDAHDSVFLASHFLEEQGIERTLADRVVEKAGGNPLFIRELALCMVEGGSGRHDAATTDGVQLAEVPDSIQSVIQARLDLLPAEERVVTQKAAVVGRFFWDSVVCRITAMPTIDSAIEDLTRRQLVIQRIPTSLEGEAEYGFAHILIRDVAYDSLPRRIRGETHVQVAGWLEERRGARAGEFAEVLSHHYESAYELLNEEGARHSGRHYSLLAARNALRRFAVEAAETHARRAVSLSRDGSEKVEALEAIGDLYLLTHRSQNSYEAYRDALQEQQESDPARAADIARLAGKAAIVATRWWGTMDQLPSEPELRALIDGGLEACPNHEVVSRARLLCSRSFASALGFDFVKDGTHTARYAVELAEETGEPNLISMAHDALVASLFPTGGWREIHEINLRRVQLIPQLSDVREVCDAYGMAAVASARKGLGAETKKFADQEVGRARGIDAGSYLQGLVWRTVANFALGDWDAVMRDHDEIEAMQPEGDLPGPMAMRSYVVAMLCHELRGDSESANRFLKLFDVYVDSERSVGGLPEAAQLLARRGEFTRARHLLPLERGEFLSLHLESYCEVVRLQQSWDDAHQAVSASLDEAAREDLPFLRCGALRLQGAAALAAGPAPEGIDLLLRSAEGFSEIGALWEEALSRLLLAEALHDARDPAVLEHARSAADAFARLGSVRELERARRITQAG